MEQRFSAVTLRLHREFPARTLTELIELVQTCRSQIDTGASGDGIPELVERLARARLTDSQDDDPYRSSRVPERR